MGEVYILKQVEINQIKINLAEERIWKMLEKNKLTM